MPNDHTPPSNDGGFVFNAKEHSNPTLLKKLEEKKASEGKDTLDIISEKTFHTVVEDIYAFMGGFGRFPEITDEQVSEICETLSGIVLRRFQERREEMKDGERKFTLRFSNLGMKDRKLWFEANVGTNLGASDPRAFLNFLLGDIWEGIILYLCKATGHKVEHEQREVEIDGIKGHMDAVIDGVMVDVKSASGYSYQNKFEQKGILEGDDPFAYIEQLKGYAQAAGYGESAWLVANKENGRLCIVDLPESVRADYDVKERIAEAKRIIEMPEPPEEKCYEPKPHGMAGNMQLDNNCKWCPFKERCWASANNGAGLRAFRYSNGITYLTEVVNEPKVEEVTIYSPFE